MMQASPIAAEQMHGRGNSMRNRGQPGTHRKEEQILGAAAVQAQVIGGGVILLGELNCSDQQRKGNAHRGQHCSCQRELPVGA